MGRRKINGKRRNARRGRGPGATGKPTGRPNGSGQFLEVPPSPNTKESDELPRPGSWDLGPPRVADFLKGQAKWAGRNGQAKWAGRNGQAPPDYISKASERAATSGAEEVFYTILL